MSIAGDTRCDTIVLAKRCRSLIRRGFGIGALRRDNLRIMRWCEASKATTT